MGTGQWSGHNCDLNIHPSQNVRTVDNYCCLTKVISVPLYIALGAFETPWIRHSSKVFLHLASLNRELSIKKNRVVKFFDRLPLAVISEPEQRAFEKLLHTQIHPIFLLFILLLPHFVQSFSIPTIEHVQTSKEAFGSSCWACPIYNCLVIFSKS